MIDSHIKNVMPKLESSRLNGVDIIARIYTHTYTHASEHKDIPKKDYFRFDWKLNFVLGMNVLLFLNIMPNVYHHNQSFIGRKKQLS